MNTVNKFYLKKQENEREILHEELKLKTHFEILTNKTSFLKGFLKNSLGQKSAKHLPEYKQQLTKVSILTSGIQLFRSVKNTVSLSRKIIKQLKS